MNINALCMVLFEPRYYAKRAIISLNRDVRVTDRSPLFIFSFQDVFNYSVCVCVGAGIGVTPFASILKSIW